MIDRIHVKNIDWALIALLLVNSIIGVVFIYSSSHYLPTDYHLKQVFWIAVGLGILWRLGSSSFWLSTSTVGESRSLEGTGSWCTHQHRHRRGGIT